MRSAVLQATTLFTISMLFTHHYTENVFDQVLENEGWQNMTYAIGNASATKIPKRPTLGASNYTTSPGFSMNTTAYPGTISAMEKKPESFYLKELPREIFAYFIITMLQYWWFIALEKQWPARPRYKDIPYQAGEDNEDREEKVVKKWIAQGRVNRATLNWCNTFLKWILDLTIGRLWYHTVELFVYEAIKLKSPKSMIADLASVSGLWVRALAPPSD
jgi:hypothetical protein